jgi:NAD(P)-dependent dehydrogenase (short-subunit alcohol dehydrogenase family)
MTGRLAGCTALVTGSSSGIGRAIALRLAVEGADLLCCDLQEACAPGGFDEEPATSTHELIAARAGKARFEQCDVTDHRAVERAFRALDRMRHPLRAVVLNAGIFLRDASILEETVTEHDKIMRVNERAVWLGCQAAGRHFVERGLPGRIICVASISGLVGVPAEPTYCASKGAVVNLVRAAAVDLAAHAINVNAIAPGFISTSMTRSMLSDSAARAESERLTPWPRLGRPQDVAGAAAFLASDDAEWITGVTLPVDGGYTCV